MFITISKIIHNTWYLLFQVKTKPYNVSEYAHAIKMEYKVFH